jgi:O-antigen/teichoic acid export membrane protein
MQPERSQTTGSRLIKNSVLNLFNTLFMISTSWIISIWVARQLGPADYGIFTLVLWFGSTLSWIIGMGLTHAVTKFIAEYSGRNSLEALGPIVRFVLKIELALSIGVTAILVFFRTPIADYFFSPSESFFFFLAFLGILPGVITGIFSAAIEGIQKFEYFTLANLILTPLSFGAKVTVLLLGYGIEGIMSVMLLFSCINALFYYFVLRKEGISLRGDTGEVQKGLRARIGKYNASVMAIILCDKVIWDKSENFFLGRFCAASQIGFYNLGYNIAQKFTSLLPTTFWRVLFPAMSNYFGSGDRGKMKRLFFLSTRYLAFVSFPVSVGGAILAYPLIHYLYGHEYIGAQRVLQIMFFASMITSLCNPGAAILYGYEKQSFIYKLGIVMAVVNIILDIVLIRPFGAVGAAVAYACTTVTGAVIGTVYTVKLMRLRYPFASIFKILLATIIMGAVMEIIMMQTPLLPGFLVSALAGACVYIVACLALGAFEQEDYELLENVKAVLPGRAKNIMDTIIRFIAEFKNGRDRRSAPRCSENPRRHSLSVIDGEHDRKAGSSDPQKKDAVRFRS